MFDGPVDAVWIENMNTVLDDNKKLCLMSGEMISMTNSMNLIFEVGDLAVASPATVSRCGMVYLEPSILGWRPIVTSWINTQPSFFTKDNFKTLNILIDWLLPPLLRLVTRQCVMYYPISDCNMIVSMMNLFDVQILEVTPEKVEALGTNGMKTRLEATFIFSAIWSLGASVDDDGRKKFDETLRQLLAEPPSKDAKLSAKFPDQGSVFDYQFDRADNKWALWRNPRDNSFQIPDGSKFQGIIVPTIDTVRYTALMDILVRNRKPTLFCGPTGTGKSVYVTAQLMNGFERDRYAPYIINFSAQTSAATVQGIIDTKLDRRRKGIFGPTGGKLAIFFVDDLNMPALEKYGAQPPIELLRQFQDHKGWYDCTDCTFRNLQDITFLCAMGPPGGGRNPVTDRFLRHFNSISITPFADETMSSIFNTILTWHFKSNGYSNEVCNTAEKVVKATNAIFRTALSKLLPTPAKSHYTFNLRDFARVIQGICMTRPEQVGKADVVARLWVHEATRVRILNRITVNAFFLMFL
jgi:dynein heavy chain